MFKRPSFFFLLYILVLMSSCGSGQEGSLSTYTVFRKDFENALYVTGEIKPVNSLTLMSPPVNRGTLVYMVEDGTFVKAGDVLCEIEVTELSSQYDNLLLEIENAEAQFMKTEANVAMRYAMLEAQVKSNEAETKIAQLDSLQLIYATPNQRRITELQLESALIQQKKLQEKLKALEVIENTDLKRREFQIQRRKDRAGETRKMLDALVMRAPRDGLVLRSHSYSTGETFVVGDPVYANQVMVTMPDLEQMKVLILAPEADYKYISVNDSVSYTFDALPGVTASGRITKKSPVGKPVKRSSTIKVFEIEASIDPMEEKLDPGFSVNCYVTLKHLRDTVVIPQIALFEQDSMKVVYLPRGRHYEAREVRTGLSSPREVVVSAGLKPGEAVLFSKPQASQVKTVTRLPAEPETNNENPDSKPYEKTPSSPPL